VKGVPFILLLRTAEEWATKICAKAPLGVQRTKEAMIQGRIMALEDGLRPELAFLRGMCQSEDDQEGLRALAVKRKAGIRGTISRRMGD
jgi:enoyl-CoA hydratase/carnithine racemase